MTFVSLPNSGQSLGGTRDQIRTNMDDLRSNDAVNHYDTNDANRGKHKRSLYVAEGSAPSTASGEGCIYTRALTSVTTPLYRKDNNTREYPVLPIRAMVSFNLRTTNGACTVNGTPLNIDSAAGVQKTAATTYTVTFQDVFPNTNYITMITDLPNAISAISQAAGVLTITTSALITSGTIRLVFLYYEV